MSKVVWLWTVFIENMQASERSTIKLYTHLFRTHTCIKTCENGWKNECTIAHIENCRNRILSSSGNAAPVISIDHGFRSFVHKKLHTQLIHGFSPPPRVVLWSRNSSINRQIKICIYLNLGTSFEQNTTWNCLFILVFEVLVGFVLVSVHCESLINCYHDIHGDVLVWYQIHIRFVMVLIQFNC